MGVPSVGAVVLVPFPFSDLTQAKLRPALVLAEVDRQDWVLCQITSNPYSDSRAVRLSAGDFARGGLRLVSYARPGKLFTAHSSLIVSEAGVLKVDALKRVTQAVIALFQNSLPS